MIAASTAEIRYAWVDYMKATCIILMVLCHFGLDGISRQFIYAFHMPAFFMVSGYLYKSKSWFKTLKAFLLPILLFSVLRLLYNIGHQWILDSEQGDIICWQNYYRSHTGQPSLFTGQWFLFVLIGIRFLLGDVKIFAPIYKYHLPISVCLIAWFTISPFVMGESDIRYYYFYLCLSAFPFMSLGILLKQRRIGLRLSLWKTFLLVLLFLPLAYFNGMVDISDSCFGLSYFLCFANAVIAFFALASVFSRLQNNKIITTFSNGTLVVLGLHMLLFLVVRDIFKLLRLCLSYLQS